jgi:elongation factor Ts
MVEISASMVKDLREKSGAAMMDCKKALLEAQGDFDKAFEILRQKGAASASKKSSRSAQEGSIFGLVSADGKHGVILELNCETDFVARNPEFTDLTKELCTIALDNKITCVDSLAKAKAAQGTVQDLITEKIAKTGENIVLKRLSALDAKDNGFVGLYMHALGGKMGALVEISSSKPVSAEEATQLGREIAMHTVSSKPEFVSKTDVPAELIEHERRVEEGKADLADKKPEIREKIVSGRVDKILAERCLMEQPFVKDPGQSVSNYLSSKGKALSTEFKVLSFVNFILGEEAPGAKKEECAASA